MEDVTHLYVSLGIWIRHNVHRISSDCKYTTVFWLIFEYDERLNVWKAHFLNTGVIIQWNHHITAGKRIVENPIICINFIVIFVPMLVFTIWPVYLFPYYWVIFCIKRYKEIRIKDKFVYLIDWFDSFFHWALEENSTASLIRPMGHSINGQSSFCFTQKSVVWCKSCLSIILLVYVLSFYFLLYRSVNQSCAYIQTCYAYFWVTKGTLEDVFVWDIRGPFHKDSLEYMCVVCVYAVYKHVSETLSMQKSNIISLECHSMNVSFLPFDAFKIITLLW